MTAQAPQSVASELTGDIDALASLPHARLKGFEGMKLKRGAMDKINALRSVDAGVAYVGEMLVESIFGNKKATEEKYRAAKNLRVDSSFLEPKYSNALAFLGELQAATDHICIYLESDPSAVDNYRLAANYLVRLGRFDKVVKILQLGSRLKSEELEDRRYKISEVANCVAQNSPPSEAVGRYFDLLYRFTLEQGVFLRPMVVFLANDGDFSAVGIFIEVDPARGMDAVVDMNNEFLDRLDDANLPPEVEDVFCTTFILGDV